MTLLPINLQLGWPSPRLFPAAQLLVATTAVLSNPSTAHQALIYGPDLGYTPLRDSIAKWLTFLYQPAAGSIPIQRISITGGASQNLLNILAAFTDPSVTQKIWMVEPTYFLASTIFEDAGFAGQLRGVPENEEGVDVEFLSAALAELDASEDSDIKTKFKPTKQYQKIFKHVIYLVPTFSNPSAKTVSLHTRQKILDLARKYDMLIVTDDVYDVLRWPESEISAFKLAPIPQRLVDLDRATSTDSSWGNTISNGSFSKIVGPGVRVGWAETSAKMTLRLSEVGSTRSGGAPSHLTSTFIHELLDSGTLQKHINNILIPTYERRFRVLMAAIDAELGPLGISVQTGKGFKGAATSSGDIALKQAEPAGGFFTYIAFPPELPCASVIAARAKEKYLLTIAYGELFEVRGDEGSVMRGKANGGFAHGARLCWAWEEEEKLVEGVKRLRDCVVDMLTEVRQL